jgi:hypothetical protein
MMNITLNLPCTAMSFDETGKYFYYFTNNYRYVVEVQTQYYFSSVYANSNHIDIACSPRTGYQDIMASVAPSGSLVIWDDYNYLYNYTSLDQVSKIIFSEYADYLISYSKLTYMINIRKTQFSNSIGSWYL